MRVPTGPDVTSSVPPSSSTRSRMPASPKPAAGASGSKPRPSSTTLSLSAPSSSRAWTVTRDAPACLTALFSASWVMR